MTALDAITKAPEDQFSTVRLWKGETPRIFRRILAALEAQDIPTDCDETVSKSVRNGLMRVFMGKVKLTRTYEVWVFASDFKRARGATERFTRMPPDRKITYEVGPLAKSRH